MASSSTTLSRLQSACVTCVSGGQRFIGRYRDFLLAPGTIFTSSRGYLTFPVREQYYRDRSLQPLPPSLRGHLLSFPPASQPGPRFSALRLEPAQNSPRPPFPGREPSRPPTAGGRT